MSDATGRITLSTSAAKRGARAEAQRSRRQYPEVRAAETEAFVATYRKVRTSKKLRSKFP